MPYAQVYAFPAVIDVDDPKVAVGLTRLADDLDILEMVLGVADDEWLPGTDATIALPAAA